MGFCDVQAKSAIVRIGASVSIIVCVRGGGGGGVRREAVGWGSARGWRWGAGVGGGGLV